MGRTALITGGSRGVGRAIALALAKDGVDHLLINYLEQDATMRALQEELENDGIRVTPLRYNLSQPDEIRQMADSVRTHTDHLDHLAHCAALTTFKPLHQVKPNQWDLVMNVSTRSFLVVVQQHLDLLKVGSSVVAVSSTGSQRFNQNYGALGVAKSALESTVRYLAVELALKGIRVNGVISGMLGGDSLPLFPEIEEVVKYTLQRTPAGRLGTPEDVAEVAVFLLTRAQWMVGQHVILDGGYCLT